MYSTLLVVITCFCQYQYKRKIQTKYLSIYQALKKNVGTLFYNYKGMGLKREGHTMTVSGETYIIMLKISQMIPTIIDLFL